MTADHPTASPPAVSPAGPTAAPKTPARKVRRRGRGEGGVYLRKDGYWIGQLSLGTRPDGTPLRRTVSGTTKAEALERLKALRDEVAGGVREATKDTVGGYLDHWLAGLELRANTAQSYRDSVERYIKPGLGTVPLAKLNAIHVETWLRGLKASKYRAVGAAEAGGRSRQLAFGTLKRALKTAVEKHIIPRNPCEGVATPKYRRKRWTAWSEDEVRLFLARAETEAREATKPGAMARYVFYVMAIGAAMREGELLGLQWSDVDLKTGVAHVHQQLIEIHGKHLGLADVKTESGRRDVPLPPTVLRVLKTYRVHQLEHGMTSSGYVFCVRGQAGKDGTRAIVPLRKSNLLKAFKVTAKAAGVPVIRIHDLRHTSLSFLLASGEQPHVVKERAGHSDIRVTLGTYAHVLPKHARAAAEKMDGVFGGGGTGETEGGNG